jgi:phenylpropionate dioxygenase-like ring-hydroxylating dioxygenase large terminal subunit
MDLRRIGIALDFWYPVARAGDVSPGKTHGVELAGEPIALFRTARGEVHALEDRCTHRQMPLRLGVVDGEVLRCGYHAWCYRTDGCLAGVPYAPRGAQLPRGARSYPCREHAGHVFVFPGTPERARDVPLPEVALWGSPDYRPMLFEREVRCHYTFMHENLLDMNHQFLHRRLLGRVKPSLEGYERGATWVRARYRFEHAGGRKHRGADLLAAAAARSAPADGKGDILTIETRYPYQTLTLERSGARAPSFALFAAYVPVDGEQRRNRSFGILMIRKPRVPGLLFLMWPFIRHFTESVFAEDRAAVEAEQEAWDRQGEDRNHEVFPLILELRDVLARNGAAQVLREAHGVRVPSLESSVSTRGK